MSPCREVSLRNRQVAPYPQEVDLGHGQVARMCPLCLGEAIVGDYSMASITRRVKPDDCPYCDGVGFFDVNPHKPTTCMPGTIGKQVMVRIRYAMGITELYHPEDAQHGYSCQSHTPRQ